MANSWGSNLIDIAHANEYSITAVVRNTIEMQVDGKHITPEIMSDPKTRKQKVQLVIQNYTSKITLESPIEIENLREMSKKLSEWANALEQCQSANALMGNK